MKRTMLALGTAAVIIGSAGAANAQGWWSWGYGRGNPVDARQYNQSHRIHQGIRDGTLTREETRRLADEQRRIADYERRAKSDGYLDPRERSNLRQMQNEASRHIYQERHDRETRFRPWYGRWW